MTLMLSSDAARYTMKTSFDAVLVLDNHGYVTDCNALACQLLQLPMNKVRGHRVTSMFQLRRLRHTLHASANSGTARPASVLYTLRRVDKTQAIVKTKRVNLDVRERLLILQDVTQSHSSVQSLGQKTRLLLEAERVGRMGAWEYDIRSKRIMWSLELQRMMGVNDCDVLTVAHTNLFYTDPSREIVRKAFKATLRHGSPYDLELEVLSASGRRIWVREVCRATRLGKRLVSVVGLVQDISDQRRMANLLANSADAERTRIGADLHDGLGQELAGLALLLQGTATKYTDQHPGLSKELVELASRARQSIQTFRELTHTMLPLELRQMGFPRVCRQFARFIKDQSGVDVHFRYRGNQLHLPTGSMAEHLYRIVQESIANAIKHGHASRIVVTLTGSINRLQLAVLDNGCGIRVKPTSDGMGLQLMQYRTRLLGGWLDVERRSVGGTSVLCVIPRE